MREVNFSIPNVNKASVHITTTLYDRRALDCTSTLPLINSLNHLAYLTTSSARIRDILTVDGGVERLVCILKEGRSKDVMDMWKWNLAFQCVVNIGVRGSENVRTRVVEADMVPVIATILRNYIQITERQKAKADAESQRNASRFASSTRSSKSCREPGSRSSFFDRTSAGSEYRHSRRQAPPPSLDLPSNSAQRRAQADDGAMDITPTPPRVATVPPERTTFARPELHNHNRSHDSRAAAQRMSMMQPLATAVPSMDTTDGFPIRPVRDVDRLPSMLPILQSEITSQPGSPATPSAPMQPLVLPPATGARPRRPSIRQQRSTSGASDDAVGEESMVSEDGMDIETEDPVVDVQNATDIESVEPRHTMVVNGNAAQILDLPNASEQQEAEMFNITHRSAVDGSLINTQTGNTNNGTMNFSPIPPPPPTNIASPTIPVNAYPNFLRNSMSPAGIQPAMPRDEDVLMSLQLLAYVSKYCDLRHYFQNTHLVPRLKVDRELQALDGVATPVPTSTEDEEDEDDDEEYLQPNDFNIFPLVEKFTVRHHSKDMQYWACVVMRNLCRKDDSKGGIRQCAYYECGKWEEFTRQFAKCRRCRRTKYCSKECQKSAWVYHRYVSLVPTCSIVTDLAYRHWCHTPP